ncbi:peptidoglycan-binding domain-containing protein [Streptomyces showdoensis]|uniref:Peptidoglycan binding-like domain-containing protein n=1 Tax=Streptomyces showdoensis TaxID=68268 RepID=A0A2P2GTT7_STREW|nr:peptidoglycan-binding domain-containing protein [Streptomyces showdoensis]KKZ74906.1 hypothetical protein VO63_05550 [Streptomyces showdoensis]
MSGQICPECGVHRPGCACARAEAQAAELAAAEDFDPLRIRPYVTLDSPEPEHPTTVLPGPLPAEVPAPRPAGDPSETMPLLLPGVAGRAYGQPEGQAYGPGRAYGQPEGRAYEPGQAYGQPEGGAYGPEQAYGGAHGNDGAYGNDGTHGPDGTPEIAHTLAYAPEERRRSGRGRALVVAGVVAAAVVGTAVMATAMIGGSDTDDRAAVPEVTTSASENVAVSEEPSTAPTPTETASPSARTTSASPSGSASATASATATAPPSASATTTASATAAPAKTTGAPSGAPSAAPTATEDPGGPTLSLGSTGDEVAELQRRLRELWLYTGPEDGRYTRKVQRAVEVYQSYKYLDDDPEGVYGPSTRRALEAETTG